MITDRELSWITKGTILAVTIGGHRYRGTAVEQVEPGLWEVALEHHGGVYELGRDEIDNLLGPPFAPKPPP